MLFGLEARSAGADGTGSAFGVQTGQRVVSLGRCGVSEHGWFG